MLFPMLFLCDNLKIHISCLAEQNGSANYEPHNLHTMPLTAFPNNCL